ncbi:energy transducer TonB [Thermosynechococcus sp.]|uniref:energy transducer TonB n=1 Tax=Thermosynechococcus sp. TaxID=2814275 RepID=UPI00391DDDB4
MLRLPIQPIWQRVSQWPVWEPTRLAIASSILLHAVILAFGRVPEPTPPELADDQLVPLVNLSPALEAELPSIEPLLPTELPPLATTTPPPLPFAGIEPPPVSFAPLAPLPPLPPLTELPPLPNPIPLQPLPSPWQLPPPARPLPVIPTTPNEDVAVAPELASPTPTPESTPEEPAATTEGEAAAALSRWFNQTRLTLNTGNLQVNLAQRITDFYPQEACGDRLQGETTVALVVTPQGQLLAVNAAPETGLLSRNPQIIRSSGSALLDQAALERVRQQSFEATGQYQALAITFAFEYRPEVCRAQPPANTPPERPSTPSPVVPPKPKPQASPTPATQPAPAQTPSPAEATPLLPSPEPSGTNSSSEEAAENPPATSPE